MKTHFFDILQGIEIFDINDDDIDKRTKLHHLIISLDLPAHISIDIENNIITLYGNVLGMDNYQKIIDSLGMVKMVSQINESIIVA